MMQTKSKKSGISFFLLVSIVIFFVSLGLAAYVFLEKKILIQDIASEQNTITSNKSGIVADTNTIQNIIDLDNRIIVAKQLIASHVSISPIFNFLEQATLQNVRFNSFTFSAGGKNATGNNTVAVQLSGVAQDWESVASQEDEFDSPSWQKYYQRTENFKFQLECRWQRFF